MDQMYFWKIKFIIMTIVQRVLFETVKRLDQIASMLGNNLVQSQVKYKIEVILISCCKFVRV